MQVVYAHQSAPSSWTSAIFLAGPTPRSNEVPSWRPGALSILDRLGYLGVVFVPEPSDGAWRVDYDGQVEWEERHRRLCDAIVFWCPRDLVTMPAFTTNVEFGLDIETGKVRYGRPDGAPKTRYLDWQYRHRSKREPASSLKTLLAATVAELGEGALRQSAERFVSLDVWKTTAFQRWYAQRQAVGHRLDDADVLWLSHRDGDIVPWCFVIRPKLWIEAERRHKSNELMFSRPDICRVVAYYRPHGVDGHDTQVLLVREVAVASRTADGYLHCLPGGSAASDEDGAQVAVDELRQEAGLDVDQDRLQHRGARQLDGSSATYQADIYSIALTSDEIQAARAREASGETAGVAEESERTYVEVRTLREIIDGGLLDWANVGMIASVILRG